MDLWCRDWLTEKNINQKDSIIHMPLNESKVYFFYGEIKSVDLETDMVDGYIATGDPDTRKDIITPECLYDIADQFRNKDIKVDYSHEAVRGKDEFDAALNATITPVASFDNNPIVDAKGVKLKSYLNRHSPKYEEIKGSIKDGHINSYSIAYFPRKWSYEVRNGEKHRRLEKVDVFNVAYTGNPINHESKFTEIMLNSLDDIDVKMRGEIMADDKKTKEEIEAKAKEEAEIKAKEEAVKKAAEVKAAEDKATVEAELKAAKEERDTAKAEVKALSEKFETANKEFIELKAKVETKDKSDPEIKAELQKEVDDLKAKFEAKSKEFDEFADKVEVKGRSEKTTNTPGVESKAIKGPIDYIR